MEWTDPETFGRALERAKTREKGSYFESFSEGQLIDHEPGLALSASGNEAWMGQTLNHDPAYWRADAARERGFAEPPIHPDYLLAATLGITVEDLSEKGGYFLGRTDVRYPAGPVYPGIELRVESEVVSTATSNSRPEYGIVTWRTRGIDADADEVVCTYERTNMIPRRESVETDGGERGTDSGEGRTDGGGGGRTDGGGGGRTDGGGGGRTDGGGGEGRTDGGDVDGERLPAELLVPEGDRFEDFQEAIEAAAGQDAAVAYRHERGRTQDAVTVAALPLSTLNTAKQHHNADVMADSPSGGIVTYGDVTRSTALGHARSDEATHREVGVDDERFHTFVTPGDTIYAFTRVLAAGADVDGVEGNEDVGPVRFEHVAFNQREEPVYSGTRTALIRRRGR